MKARNKALITLVSNNHLHSNNTLNTFPAQSLKRISELAVDGGVNLLAFKLYA